MAENTELMTVDNICNRVYIIRGQQVMLDYDLAEIYGYEVKRLNEQVKRNITRFPEDFMFQLTKEEIDFVKSQFATSRNRNMYAGQDGGRRKAIKEGLTLKNCRMHSRSKVFICLLQFSEVSLQNNKVFLLCVHFVKCVII